MVLDGMMSFCADYRIIQEVGVNSLHKIAAVLSNHLGAAVRAQVGRVDGTAVHPTRNATVYKRPDPFSFEFGRYVHPLPFS
jgi:hypothetical protein